MTDLKLKDKELNKVRNIIITISIIFAAACIGFGIFFLSDKMDERAAVEQIAREQREIEWERTEQERLGAVSEELGIDTKYILPDGVDTKWTDLSYRAYSYKAESMRYLVIFDENNDIQTIVEDTKIDD